MWLNLRFPDFTLSFRCTVEVRYIVTKHVTNGQREDSFPPGKYRNRINSRTTWVSLRLNVCEFTYTPNSTVGRANLSRAREYPSPRLFWVSPTDNGNPCTYIRISSFSGKRAVHWRCHGTWSTAASMPLSRPSRPLPVSLNRRKFQ